MTLHSRSTSRQEHIAYRLLPSLAFNWGNSASISCLCTKLLMWHVSALFAGWAIEFKSAPSCPCFKQAQSVIKPTTPCTELDQINPLGCLFCSSWFFDCFRGRLMPAWAIKSQGSKHLFNVDLLQDIRFFICFNNTQGDISNPKVFYVWFKLQHTNCK